MHEINRWQSDCKAIVSARIGTGFRQAGASVDDSSLLVKIDRALIEAALDSAPGEFVMYGSVPEANVTLGGDNIAFVSVGGAPHISDLDRGKRPGGIEDTRNIIRLSEHFDVLQMQSPNVESQDIPVHLRHYHVTEAQITLSRKPFFIFSRGSAQVEDAFAMTRIARGLSQADFEARPWCYTVINTSSPRQLDVPMCRCADVPGNHRFCPRRANVGNHAVYAGRRGARNCRRLSSGAAPRAALRWTSSIRTNSRFKYF